MPVLSVKTNVKAGNVPADFKSKATEVIAKTLGKPASYVAIHIVPDQNMSFAGTDEPTALCELISIGSLSVESNKKHSKIIMDFLETTLKIKPSRVYITFRDENKANIGYSKTTFHDLL